MAWWRGGGVEPPPGRGPAAAGLRFAFYGRVSIEDWQDPVTSRARQREQAVALVRGHGVIVAEFFDAGQSRTVAWGRRPEAAALIAHLADPGRGWDAIVVGEYERAFYGSQYAVMALLFEHYGVQLWMPEAGGQVDFASEHDEQAMTVRGLSSKREVTRTSIRGADRDGGPGTGAGPVPGRASAVRVPAWVMPARTRTRRTPPGDGGRIGSSPTRKPRISSGGSLPGDWRAIRWRGSRGR